MNGSGKHNNWSLSTNYGKNLFDPGKKPQDNLTFLLFLCSVIQAVDDYQDLLRISAASAGNDHRLGAAEAPPAIVSMCLGEDLTEILDAIKHGEHGDNKTAGKVLTGVEVLPDFARDTADRNRTSPLVFTGNKFEFRMLGSSASIADANIVLNTAVADVVDALADRLEKAEDVTAEAYAWMKETLIRHGRIIFNGNNYSEEWVREAHRRGLTELKTTADAVPHFLDEKNVALFTRHKIFARSEIASRCEIMLDNYCKVIRIEVLAMIDMANKEILPAALEYFTTVAKAVKLKNDIGLAGANDADTALSRKLKNLIDLLCARVKLLSNVLAGTDAISNSLELSQYYRDHVLPAMADLRAAADELEDITAEACRPYPTYSDLLFKV